MANNDDVVWGLPTIQCPSCQFALDCSNRQVVKFSKEQRQNICSDAQTNQSASYGTTRKRSQFDEEDFRSEEPENTFLVLSCSNLHCRQYNKIKILRVPRLHAPSIKVDL